MTTLQIAALVVSLTAALAFVNARFIRMPSQIGLMAITLGGSLIVVALDAAHVIDVSAIRDFVERVDFGPTLLHGMLGLLLFAGALHVDLHELTEQKWPVAALSLGATVLSTAIVGPAVYFVLHATGLPIALIDALLFGALISPTDPIAVLGALKSSRVPRTLAVQITGESLFNDGVGVVLFVVLLSARAGADTAAGDVAMLFAREAVGGAAFGLALGYVGYRMIKSIDDYPVEVLITLAIVLGGYATAEAIQVSAPIGAVVAGIVIGNRAREHGMSERTRHYIDAFWEIIDEVLNAVLFLMLGLEATRLAVSWSLAIAAAITVVVVLAARFASVGTFVLMLRPFRRQITHAVKILTWGGLRGGLSVALALSLPPGSERDTILVLTYAVVSVAILVQGITLPRLLRHLGC